MIFLEKSFIRPNVSPWVTLILYLRKKYCSLRMCIDYLLQKKVTITIKSPLPRINDLFDQLRGGAINFSKIDLKLGYHQLRERESHILLY